MPIQRIRRFNTRDTYPGQELDNDLSQAVVAGSTVYLRGQVGSDLRTGETVGVGDAGAQAEQAMRNVEQLLGECGATPMDVVKIVVYIVRREDRPAVYRAVGRALKGVFPVSTGLIVAGLAKEDWLMEIDVTAVRRYEAGKP
ncbi:MAG: RidA family protein [Tistlia sp.]|uniref:RidA family protein n=1 Tax=Tistlia sp. TaxID=3057121 RepID=UPI0034A29C9B